MFHRFKTHAGNRCNYREGKVIMHSINVQKLDGASRGIS